MAGRAPSQSSSTSPVRSPIRPRMAVIGRMPSTSSFRRCPVSGSPGPTRDAGWITRTTAAALADLMRRLGYDRYGAQGGDLGALIAPELGHVDGDHVGGRPRQRRDCGIHPLGDVDANERATLTDLDRRASSASRISLAGGKRVLSNAGDQTADDRLALTDRQSGNSPGRSTDGRLDPGAFADALTRDQILTNVMLYWPTRTATSAARLYYENMHAPMSWGRPTLQRRSASRRSEKTSPSGGMPSGPTTSFTGPTSTWRPLRCYGSTGSADRRCA